MEYRGLMPLYAEFMIRFHAKSALIGGIVGMRAFADPGPGTLEEKLNRAMQAVLDGELESPGIAPATPPRVIEPAPGEPVRRGPGRPPKDRTNQNG